MLKSRNLLTAVAAACVLATSSMSPASAEKKNEFNIAWTIYVGWMPWPYAAESGIVKKWADKYAIKINVTQINDYVESINQYTAGKFDGVTVTNMDALTIPAAGGVARISRQIPWAVAAEILLVGDAISAQEALKFGLVNRVVSAEAVMPTARELAARMAQNSPFAMRKAKEVMQACSGLTLGDAFAVEDASIKLVLRSEDAKEGSRAFVEKRAPAFVGR